LYRQNSNHSSDWELKHKEVLEQIIQNSSNVFKLKYGYNLHKGNNSIEELLEKAELNIIGLSFGENKTTFIQLMLSLMRISYAMEQKMNLYLE
jgi:hypothetical protein